MFDSLEAFQLCRSTNPTSPSRRCAQIPLISTLNPSSTDHPLTFFVHHTETSQIHYVPLQKPVTASCIEFIWLTKKIFLPFRVAMNKALLLLSLLAAVVHAEDKVQSLQDCFDNLLKPFGRTYADLLHADYRSRTVRSSVVDFDASPCYKIMTSLDEHERASLGAIGDLSHEEMNRAIRGLETTTEGRKLKKHGKGSSSSSGKKSHGKKHKSAKSGKKSGGGKGTRIPDDCEPNEDGMPIHCHERSEKCKCCFIAANVCRAMDSSL